MSSPSDHDKSTDRKDRKPFHRTRTLLVGAVLAAAPALAWAQPPGFNYDESNVPVHDLPDPLIAFDGTRITDRKAWQEKRRPEILDSFKSQVYGHVPPLELQILYDQSATEENVLDGLATRKQIRIRFPDENDGPTMDLLIYLPRDRSGPVPVFLGLNFHGNHTINTDPGIRLPRSWVRNRGDVTANRATDAGRGTSSSRWPVERILSRGYGLATIYYGDIDPDFDDEFQNGIHPLFYREGQTRPDEDQWGSIGAWAWGLSRALDYFESDDDIEHREVAVLGHSRLGKTALWAGACDQRFAIVISNNSGCGGAAISRRRFGETVKRINDAFPHWFCRNFRKYNDNEDELPVDQHMLLSLIAPRPVYVASAEQDLWADPRGEFLSCAYATPVYQLLGRDGPGADETPEPNRPLMKTIGYHVRHGKHDVTDFDWRQFLKFADRHLR